MRRPSSAGAWLIGAGLVAVAVPALLLWRAQPPLPQAPERGDVVTPVPLPAEPEAGRRLFLDPLDPARAPMAADAPKLVGIAGRLPDQAIAMVRNADGTTRIVSPGQSHEGWTLESLSPDAALFTRGDRRVRSFLPAPEPLSEPAADDEGL